MFQAQHNASKDRWQVWSFCAVALLTHLEQTPAVIEDLKAKAKKLGLWNLYLPKNYKESPGLCDWWGDFRTNTTVLVGLTNLEYAHMAELMGKYPLASEACNCSAPDTGNMEVLAKYGTDEQKAKWLVPLMNGDIRSVFFMTEPAVASSDATNIESHIRKVSRQQ